MRFFSTLLFLFLICAAPAYAMPGFFVGMMQAPITNPDTKIILSFHSGRAVVTLMPYIKSADTQEIAWIIPVPADIKESDITPANTAWFDAPDALSASRLIIENDPNPCTNVVLASEKTISSAMHNTSLDNAYDISILSADEGKNLVKWLETHGYKLPDKADRVLRPYTEKNLSFIIAKTRIDGGQGGYLKPLQLSYATPTMALAVRPSLINAPPRTVEKQQPVMPHVLHAMPDLNGPEKHLGPDVLEDGAQQLTLMVITAQGRAGSPTLRSLPLNNGRMDTVLPSFVRDNFPEIASRILNYRAKSEGQAMMIEYAGEAALPADTLAALGASWQSQGKIDAHEPSAQTELDSASDNLLGATLLPQATALMRKSAKIQPAAAGKPILTRLYIRYLANTQDIPLQESADRNPVASVFHVSMPFQPEADPKNACDAIAAYQQSVITRDTHAGELLKRLTGLPADALNPASKPAP